MKTPLFALSEDALILGTLLKSGYDVRYFMSLDSLIETLSLAPHIIFLDDANFSEADFARLQMGLKNIPNIVIRGGNLGLQESKTLHLLRQTTGCDEVVSTIKNVGSDTAVHTYHPKKVLIIEDNKSINEMYCIAFEKEGCLVSSAYDGLDGITKAASIKPDIIILDIMMPNMDGFEMLKVLKSNTDLEARVIVNSNLEGVDEENKARALGADGFLRKSKYTPLDVVSRILAGEFNG